MSFHRPTKEAAAGHWRGILLQLGVPGDVLRDRHGPCPFCGGKDRFRWDNNGGRGTWICGQCGAGDGMDFAERFLGLEFQETASRIDAIIGNTALSVDRIKPEVSEEQLRDRLRGLWKASALVESDDLADTYLKSRGLDELIYPKALRFAPKVNDGEGNVRPCLLAIVTDMAGKPVTMHRTFLRPDGLGKAEMEAPRKLMPGSLPDGACVRLSDNSSVIGIAEGIETAFAASALFDIPVWAAINSTILSKWIPPEGCEEVVIFGDNDGKFGGQAAAYRLAHRLAVKGMQVTVKIPKTPGHDWLDEYDMHNRGEPA